MIKQIITTLALGAALTASNPTGNKPGSHDAIRQMNPSLMGMNLSKEFQALPVLVEGDECKGCTAQQPSLGVWPMPVDPISGFSSSTLPDIFWAGVIPGILGEADSTIVIKLDKISVTPMSGNCLEEGGDCVQETGCTFPIRIDLLVMNTGPSALDPQKVMIGSAFTKLLGDVTDGLGNGNNPDLLMTPSATVPGAFTCHFFVTHRPECGSTVVENIRNTKIDLYTYVTVDGFDRHCKMVPFGDSGILFTADCDSCGYVSPGGGDQ